MRKDADMSSVPMRRRQFTTADYHRMGEAGIFEGGPRVELIEGEVVEMCPIGSRHVGCVNALNKLLVMRCGDDAIVQVQGPIHLDDYSEPEPDLLVLRHQADFYRGAHAEPPDTLLAIEVADSSLSFDRKVKAPLYAARGVCELWIVSLVEDAIDVYSEPHAEGYRLVRRALRGDTLRLPLPGERDCSVEEILG